MGLLQTFCHVFFPPFVFFANTENYISEACQVQGTLLARNQYLLNELYHAIADHRKYVYLDELEKQRNIILQIMIREIDTKMTFLRNHNT